MNLTGVGPGARIIIKTQPSVINLKKAPSDKENASVGEKKIYLKKKAPEVQAKEEAPARGLSHLSSDVPTR